MSRERSSIVKGFISILGGKFGIIIVSLFSTPVIVRILPPKEYGTYAFLLSVISIGTIIANIGANDGVRKYIAENPRDEERSRALYREHLRYGVGGAIIIATILFIIYLFRAKTIIPGKYRSYVPLLALVIFLNQPYQISRFGLMGLEKEKCSEIINVSYKLILSVSGITLILYGLGVSGLLIGHGIAALCMGVVSMAAINKLTSADSIKYEIYRREKLTYSISSFLLILLTSSLYHVDILLLGNLSSRGNLGYYKSALVVAELIWFVPQAVQTIILHSSSGVWEDRNIERINQMATAATKFTLMISLICTIGLFVLSDEFVGIYFGKSYLPAVGPLIILLPGALFFSISRPIFAIGQGKGTMRYLVLATLLASLLNLILNLILIPRHGIVGAATATSIGYGSMVLFHTFAAIKMGYNPVKGVPVLRIIISGTVTLYIIRELNYIINSDIVSILVVAVVGGSIFFAFNFALGVVTKEELIDVRGLSN